MVAGSVLFREGQDARNASVIRQGRFKIARSSENGKTLLVRIAHPGDILGLSALLTDSPYEFTAVALETSQITVIRKAEFLKLLCSDPNVAFHSSLSLNAEYRSALNIACRLALAGSVAARLAHLILELSDGAHSFARSDGIDIPLTHEEMASMLGTSRESVTRLLNEFKRRNLIRTNGSMIKIVHRAALEHLL